MTLAEAQKIAVIVANADGGCHACVESLVNMLIDAFPEFDWDCPEDTNEFYKRWTGSRDGLVIVKERA